jgi:hypothetical protein
MGVLTQARASLVDPMHLPAELEKTYPLAPTPASSEGIKKHPQTRLGPALYFILTSHITFHPS